MIIRNTHDRIDQHYCSSQYTYKYLSIKPRKYHIDGTKIHLRPLTTNIYFGKKKVKKCSCLPSGDNLIDYGEHQSFDWLAMQARSIPHANNIQDI